jgi:cytochrome c oxidase cbb3-type subunit 4
MVAGIVTALLLAVFIGGWACAWSPRRRDAFDRAARLPLREDDGREDAP